MVDLILEIGVVAFGRARKAFVLIDGDSGERDSNIFQSFKALGSKQEGCKNSSGADVKDGDQSGRRAINPKLDC